MFSQEKEKKSYRNTLPAKTVLLINVSIELFRYLNISQIINLVFFCQIASWESDYTHQKHLMMSEKYLQY